MNIAILASAFYPHVGGVEQLCRQLAHAYIAQGHGCIVLTNRWPRDLPRREAYQGIDGFRLPFWVPEGSLSHRLTHRRIMAELVAILGAAGLMRSKAFDWGAIAAHYLDLYERVLPAATNSSTTTSSVA